MGIIVKGSLLAIVEYEFSKPMLAIHSLAVATNHSRKGLGKQILSYVISQHPGFPAEVETAKANLPAVKLYQKMGFNVISEYETEEKIAKVVLRKFPHSLDL